MGLIKYNSDLKISTKYIYSACRGRSVNKYKWGVNSFGWFRALTARREPGLGRQVILEVARSLRGSREWLVLLVAVDGVLPLPARAAEVLEALEVSAEVGAHDATTHGAERVLQVGIDLHLLVELGGLDLHKACLHCLHKALLVAKGHTA